MTRSTATRFALGLTLAVVLPATRAQDDTPTPERPQATVTPAEFDFGEVWRDQPATGKVTIRNTGTLTLTGLSARSSCGCTVPTKPQETLTPGESTVIEVTYDAKRVGPAHKNLIIEADDPRTPGKKVELARVPVKGTVKAIFNTEPQERIQMRGLDPGEVQSESIRLINNYDKPVTLKLKEGQDFGPFRVALTEITPGKEYQLTAMTVPPLRVGLNRADVTLETDSPELPPVTIFVSAHAQPRVLVSPFKLFVSPSAPQPYNRILRVQFPITAELEITRIEVMPMTIEYATMPREPERERGRFGFQRVRVTLPPFAEFPDEGGHITIHTNDPDPRYQEFVIPIEKQHEPTADAPADPDQESETARKPPPHGDSRAQ